jgi:methyl-accepting chemotaxis protein PixJ
MDSTNSSTPVNKSQKIRQFIQSNLVGAIVISTCLNLGLTGVATWSVWNTAQDLKVTIAKQNRQQNLNSKLTYWDEVLTMSALMYSSTGETKWDKRYTASLPDFDKIWTEFIKDAPPSPKIDTANTFMLATEVEVFKLAKQGKLKEASALLSSPKYQEQKRIYAAEVATIIAKNKSAVDREVNENQQALSNAILLASIGLCVSVATGLLVTTTVRSYIRDRQLSQEALQTSQRDLMTVNMSLEKEALDRELQEQSIRQENEQLQQDIGELLDVVSEIEAGDLTIQAQVNDRATGLVSDTLNRLVESLSRTLRQVSVAAHRVDNNSKTQKELAATVAQNTGKQTEEVGQMLLLTRNVRQSAQNTMQQLVVTNRSLLTLQSSVAEGQKTISNLDREIDVLQSGSDRIVQEIKTLGEFVGLADRFVQDQGEIVTQTQILALNASLVAARAAEQRDPKLFASVAREFELIATQVSQLAQQNNEGLVSLEQRSSQIHKVVSAVDIDVQKLGGLVNTFTQGVKQASDVFATVQAVTAQAVESGNMVSTASQRIVSAADSTTIAIESISSLSKEISDQSQDAQNLGDRLNMLSTDLLDNIQVFKLPALPALPAVEPSDRELAISV